MRTSLTGVMAAMRDKSQSVNIAVLAGAAEKLPRCLLEAEAGFDVFAYSGCARWL